MDRTVWHDCAAQMRALQIGTIELRSCQISTLEVGRNEGSAATICLAQVSTFEVGTNKDKRLREWLG